MFSRFILFICHHNSTIVPSFVRATKTHQLFYCIRISIKSESAQRSSIWPKYKWQIKFLEFLIQVWFTPIFYWQCRVATNSTQSTIDFHVTRTLSTFFAPFFLRLSAIQFASELKLCSEFGFLFECNVNKKAEKAPINWLIHVHSVHCCYLLLLCKY